MATLQLQAQQREVMGRKVKQLRRDGIVPVVVYGNVDNVVNLQVPARALERTLQSGGTSQLIQLHVDDGSRHNVLIRELQRHPVRRTLMHADFYAISMTEKQQVSVPVVSVNTPEAMAAGLMVLQALDAVEIEALPASIPASIEVDITDLTVETAITVADLPSLEGVEYLTDPTEALFTMLVPRIAVEDEEETELEGEEIEEGEEVVDEEEAEEQ